MGDLVTGVGDEVLLFAAFFLLSLIMVALLAHLRPRERERRTREGGRGDTQQQQQPQQQQQSETEDNGQTGSPLTDQGGHPQLQVRSRHGGDTTGDCAASSGGARLSVRLVLSGLAQGTRTLSLQPDCSLFELKRYQYG